MADLPSNSLPEADFHVQSDRIDHDVNALWRADELVIWASRDGGAVLSPTVGPCGHRSVCAVPASTPELSELVAATGYSAISSEFAQCYPVTGFNADLDYRPLC